MRVTGFPGVYSFDPAPSPTSPPFSPNRTLLQLNTKPINRMTSNETNFNNPPKLRPPPGYVPSLFLTPASPTQTFLTVNPVHGSTPSRPQSSPIAPRIMRPRSHYSKLSGVLDVPAHSGVQDLIEKRPIPPEIPPKIPPKPPFIRRKLALSFSSKKNDYANCVSQNRCSSGEVGPLVERSLKPKLAPKHMNPSLPNLRKLYTDENATPSPPPTTNPFSTEYCSTSQNHFAANSAYRLGEEFFASLFPSNDRNLHGKREMEVKSKKAVTFSNKVVTENEVEPGPNNPIVLTRLPTLTVTTNTSLTDPIPSRPPVGAPAGTASSSVVPPTGGQQTSAKKSQEAQDKYAALKNLDDIFRTSVSVQEGKLDQ